MVLPPHVCSTNKAKSIKTNVPMKTKLILARLLTVAALTATTVGAQNAGTPNRRNVTKPPSKMRGLL